MNNFEHIGGEEARVEYLDADFNIISPGTYVVCAVTGTKIPLDELKYWSVAKQEPYVDVEASAKATLG